MLQFIRERLVKVAIIVTLIMFVGLIFFGWGMSAYQSKKVSTSIGKINEKEIKLDHFYRVYNNTLNNIQKQEELTTIKRKYILDKVWNQFIEENLINDFFEKNNITVSSNEMINFLKMNPPQELRTNPNFLTNGVFDTTKYYNNFLNNPEVLKQNADYVRYLEETYKQYLLKFKLQTIINNVPSMSKLDENEYISKKTQKGMFEFIKTPISNFMNSAKIDDKDAKKYYDKHKKLYKRDESINLAFIKILKKPSKFDTNLVLKDAKEIIEKIKEGENFNDLAKEYSDSKGVDSTGGDIGYVRTSFLPEPIKNEVDSLKSGEVTNPIIFGKGIYVYKVKDIKIEKDKDSIPQKKVNLSEIFMKISITGDTEDSIRNTLDTLKKALTLKDSKIKIDTTGYFEISKIVPYEGYIENLSKFAYKAEKNEISDVLENDNAFYVFKLLDKKEPGYISFDKVKKSIINKLQKEKAKELAAKFIEDQYLKAKNKKISMDSLANTNNDIQYYKTDKFVNGLQYIQGAGYDNEFTAVAFSLKDNQTTKNAVTTSTSAFIIKRLATEIDSVNTKDIQKEVYQYFKSKNKDYFENWFNNLKDNSNIEDYRYQFF